MLLVVYVYVSPGRPSLCSLPLTDNEDGQEREAKNQEYHSQFCLWRARMAYITTNDALRCLERIAVQMGW